MVKDKKIVKKSIKKCKKKKTIKRQVKQKGGSKKKKDQKKSQKKSNQKGGKLEGISYEEYEGFFDDDIGLDLFDDLVESGKANEICRGSITDSYIKTTFEKSGEDGDIHGFLAKKNGKYIGFIIYYKRKDHLYLDLICTKGSNKGLGQELIKKMEKYARSKKIRKLIGDAVLPAMPFYLKNGWVSTGKTSDGKRNIMKMLKPIKKRKIKKIQEAKKEKKEKKIIKKKGFFAKLFGK